MSLAVVCLVEVDPKIANNQRSSDGEAQEQSRKLDNLDHGHSLADLVNWIEDFKEDQSQRGREYHPTDRIVGQFGLFDALFENAHTELASVQVDAHRNKDPLVQHDKVSDAQEKTATVVKQAQCLYRHAIWCQTTDVYQNNHRRDQFAEEGQLEEDEVSPEASLADLSGFGVGPGWCHVFAHMKDQPCQN